MSLPDEEMFGRLDQLQLALDQLREEYRKKVAARFNPHVLNQACQGKKRYRGLEAAGKAAATARANGSTDELRIYSCAFCDAYHLTKTPLSFLVGAA